MSDWAKSDGSDSLLGIKRGKTEKNCQKHGENCKFFRGNCSIFERKCNTLSNHSRHSLLKRDREQMALVALLWRATRWILSCHSFVKSDESNSLTVALLKDQWEWIAHSCSLKRAILSKRVKRERAKERIPNHAIYAPLSVRSKNNTQTGPQHEFYFTSMDAIFKYLLLGSLARTFNVVTDRLVY